ncbi:REP-associated tyrosine transposase [Leeuwenhoekiella sp. LLG6367-2.1]|uniref:REP-associated tyrosine transposase n=1 Tax=Leeuwenhoekiella sp. LLG6367-2.1 TaxID=3160833 RepID=UPI0038653D46
MSRNYKFHNPEGLYFVSFAVIEWLDVFTETIYNNILLDSLSYCQTHKGMEIIAWCIMTNHIHLIFRSIKGEKPEQLLGDFKRFTSKAVVKTIQINPTESRKEFLLEHFKNAAEKSSNVKYYQFWRHDNKPIELWSNKVIWQKIEYIHNNPVKAGMVSRPEDYKYSSAIDYAGEEGLLKDILVFKYYG